MAKDPKTDLPAAENPAVGLSVPPPKNPENQAVIQSGTKSDLTRSGHTYQRRVVGYLRAVGKWR
jgi:hypothetical protein